MDATGTISACASGKSGDECETEVRALPVQLSIASCLPTRTRVFSSQRLFEELKLFYKEKTDSGHSQRKSETVG